MSAFLAAVTQRPFWSAAQIKEIVRKRGKNFQEASYTHPNNSKSDAPPPELHAMPIFMAEKQRTWLLADPYMAWRVLDDRRWEEPRVQLLAKLQETLPVRADETWSEEAGVLYFGDRTRGWLYSKELFQNESVKDAVTQFLLSARR